MDNLVNVNSDPNLDFLANYNRLLNEQDDFNNPYLFTQLNCNFYDINSLPLNPTCKQSPCYISINIQSLNSIYKLLKDLILELVSKNINIEIIALQEIWQIQHIELVNIPGFHPLISTQR